MLHRGAQGPESQDLPCVSSHRITGSDLSDVCAAFSRSVCVTLEVEKLDTLLLSQIGSGSLPVETLPSAALMIRATSGEDSDLRGLAKTLRQLPVPVIGRMHKGALWLDLRCLEADQERVFTDQLAGIGR